MQVGTTRTTDAPFQETEEAINAAKQAGILAVEMEAAALYAFARARARPVLCFAHVTNQIGQIEGDFEKGAADGAARPTTSPVRPGHREEGPARDLGKCQLNTKFRWSGPLLMTDVR